MAKLHENIIQFDVEINEDGTISLPDSVIEQIKKAGNKAFTISLQPNSVEQLAKLNIPVNVVEQIQNVQELPQSVVLEFFQSKSSISDKSFLNRIEAYA